MYINIMRTSLLVSGLALLAFASCNKEDTSNTAQFLGEWRGRDCDTNSKTYSITAGPNNYSVYLNYTVGIYDTCKREVKLLGNVSDGGASTFSIATQNVTDQCGVSYAMTGSGYIKSDTIYITTTYARQDVGIVSCMFKGHR